MSIARNKSRFYIKTLLENFRSLTLVGSSRRLVIKAKSELIFPSLAKVSRESTEIDICKGPIKVVILSADKTGLGLQQDGQNTQAQE